MRTTASPFASALLLASLCATAGLAPACPSSGAAEAGGHDEAGEGEGERGGLEPFAQAFVDAHNAARAGATPAPPLSLPPVTWSDEIAAVAQAWADRCVFEHSSGPYGENLALFSSPSTTPEQVVAAWVSEVADYDYAANACAAGAQCGHYTQVVWRDSGRIGCAVTDCPAVAGFGPGLLWVCNYDPPGNFIGRRPY
jgi:uncharacterized protein YkwD